MSEDFDPTEYARAPRLDVPSAIALAVKLTTSVPATATTQIKDAAKAVEIKTTLLQTAWKERDREDKRVDTRPIDVLADGTMGRFMRRIEDYAGLPGDLYPLAERARKIVSTLFPNGLAFLKSDYPTQWAETQKRIERIDEEQLAADIDKIAGPEFLAELRRVHALYGDAIGVTKTKTTSTTNLSDPLRKLLNAMTSYTMLLASIVMDEDAADNVRAMARAALKPMDDYRANAGRTSADKQEPAEAPTEAPATENNETTG